MNEETDVDTGLMNMDDEQMNEEREGKGSQEKRQSYREMFNSHNAW